MSKTLALLFLLLIAVAIPQSADAAASIAPSQEPMISSWCEDDKPNSGCGIVDFSMPCSQVVKAYTWLDGTCCSLQDRDAGKSCRLRVDGRLAFCSYKVKDAASYYQHHMTDKNKGTCPASKYKIPFQTKSTPAPSPVPPAVSGICITDTPDKDCGISKFAEPCSKVVAQNLWSGTCCSLSDTRNGGCKLTVDGPGSECTVSDLKGQSSFTTQISTENDSKCPASQYDVLAGPVLSQYKICWASVFTDCAVAAGCTEYSDVTKTLQTCQGKDAGKTAVCVNKATNECNDSVGRPVPAVCDALPGLKATGNLKPRVCKILKKKCGDLAPKIRCE